MAGKPVLQHWWWRSVAGAPLQHPTGLDTRLASRAPCSAQTEHVPGCTDTALQLSAARCATAPPRAAHAGDCVQQDRPAGFRGVLGGCAGGVGRQGGEPRQHLPRQRSHRARRHRKRAAAAAGRPELCGLLPSLRRGMLLPCYVQVLGKSCRRLPLPLTKGQAHEQGGSRAWSCMHRQLHPY